MVRPTDENRVLWLLAEAAGLPNSRVRTELGLSDARYLEVRDQLLEGGLVEKYRCRGGGVRLTSRGEVKVYGAPLHGESAVAHEKDLYAPLIDRLSRDASEDAIEAVLVDTSNLRKRGKWQNPDVTRVTVESYRYLQTFRAMVTTYEVKQWGRWDISAVFEAASHDRFVHEAYVVLEWAKGVPFDAPEHQPGMMQIASECRRFGVGLARMTPHYSGFRFSVDIEPTQREPHDRDVDAFLDYMFERRRHAREQYLAMLNGVRTGWNEVVGSANASEEDE